MFVTECSRAGSRPPPLVIAHRGASRVEPDNTLIAFGRAATVGADVVEPDVRRCGETLLVHHDAWLSSDRRAIATAAGDERAAPRDERISPTTAQTGAERP